MRLAERIRKTVVAPREVALFALGQAGFCVKTGLGTVAYVDPYLSDCCERLFGFRRMIPPVIAADEVEADLLISTHAHADHLDLDAAAVIAQDPRTHFVGAPDCAATYRDLGLSEERYTILPRGKRATFRDLIVRATYADHGDLAPEAIGVVLTMEGISLYDVGDSGLAVDWLAQSVGTVVDVMIAPINGRFGNLDARDACVLAEAIRPQLLIASHFGMFVEHDGDPARFLEEAQALPPDITALVLAPGELLTVEKRTDGSLTFTRETLPA
jgi:L-ascorbate 6-phosphate lactonase